MACAFAHVIFFVYLCTRNFIPTHFIMKKFFLIGLLGMMTMPVLASTTVTLTVANFQTTSFSSQGISVEAAKANAANDPAYNSSSKDLRIYAKGTLTVSADQPITHISFTLSEQGKKRLAPLTANTGNVTVVGDPDFTVDWAGSATSVTLTVGDKADYGTENTKAGQFDFTAIIVTYDGVPGDTSGYAADTLSCNEVSYRVYSNPEADHFYVAKGFVRGIDKEYSSSTHAVTFRMNDDDTELGIVAGQVYCNSKEDAPNVGDLVWVKGQWKITTYGWSRDEVRSVDGGSFGIIRRGGDVIFYEDDFDGGVESTGGEVSCTKTGVTVYTDRGFNNEVHYQLRVYAGAVFEISSDETTIEKIRFTFCRNCAKSYTGGLSEVVTVNAMTWRVDSMASQARIEKIEIYFGDENQGVTTPSLREYGEVSKVFRNGQVLILRGDKTYTLTGQELK